VKLKLSLQAIFVLSIANWHQARARLVSLILVQLNKRTAILY